MHYPSFTHIHCVHDMSDVLYPGLSNFRIRGDCVAVSWWMYFQVVIVRTPARVCLLHWYSHLLLFTNCRGKCHEVGHISSDLDIFMH